MTDYFLDVTPFIVNDFGTRRELGRVRYRVSEDTFGTKLYNQRQTSILQFITGDNGARPGVGFDFEIVNADVPQPEIPAASGYLRGLTFTSVEEVTPAEVEESPVRVGDSEAFRTITNALYGKLRGKRGEQET